MRIPVLIANFHSTVFLDGVSRTRIVAGSTPECQAAKMEYDTKLGLVLIWPKRPREVRSASRSHSFTIGAVLAEPSSIEVSVECLETLSEEKTVKPGSNR